MAIQFSSKVKMFTVILSAFFISSCSLMGVHFQVHNPKKAGEYPKETRQNILLNSTTKYRTCFHPYHYELNVSVVPKSKFISGKVIISSKAIADFDTMQIDLYKNMKIDSIVYNHKRINYKRDEGAVFVAMPKRIKQNEKFDLTITYQGNPIEARKPPWDGGFVWKKDKDNNPWIGVSCETEGASLWWPNKDMMYDEADSTDVLITCPAPLMAVSNGVLKDSIHNSNETNTYHWHISYPINNYNITLYIGALKLLHDKYESKVTGKTTQLNHYVLQYNYEIAAGHFLQVKDILGFYERMFGEYPWQRDGFKFVESPYEGMEHQTAIAYGNGYKNDYDYFDYIILHETAHEWWGNSVTAADLSDGWLHEGFASYCEALYVESVKGNQAYLDYLYYQRIGIKNKRPVVRKRGIRYFDYHDEDIYTKGSWVLHTLRYNINNDSLFFDILKSFRIENNQKQILSETFVDFVNKKTGKDYNWFFNQYLFRREVPILEYYWDNNDVYYRWTKTNDDFVMPIEIEVVKDILTIYPTTKIQKIELRTNSRSFLDNSDHLLLGNTENKKLKKLFSQ